MAVRSTERRRRGQSRIFGPLIISAAIVAAAFVVSRPVPQPMPAALPAPIVAEFDTVSVPVPVAPVSTGTKVSEIQFKQVAYPRHQLPRDALLSLESVAGAVTVAPLPANLPIFSQNLSLRGQISNPVVERIPAGMRAMTINVDATTAVEGWAGSGAIVDVLLVQKDRTAVVAEKVKILSAERSVRAVDGEGTPNVPKTVTLLVTQEQCLAINTAIPLGKIAFALRGTTDEQGWNDGTFTADRLRGPPVSNNPEPSTVNGYIAVKDQENSGAQKRSYALMDGKWIKTEVVPEGFLIGDN